MIGSRFVVLLALLFVPTVAAADAISVPPPCPPGATGRSSHLGAYCVPARCGRECSERGGRCGERAGLCVVRARIEGASMGGPFSTTENVVVGECRTRQDCAGRAVGRNLPHGASPLGAVRCVQARRCVEPPDASRRGWPKASVVGDRSAATPWIVAGLGLVGLLAARRSR